MTVEHQISIEPAHQKQVIDQLAELIERFYVFPDHAEDMASTLRNLGAGIAHRNACSGDDLACELTGLIHGVFPDRHLRVRWFAEPGAALQGARAMDSETAYRAAKVDSFGIHDVKLLPGKVGYFVISEFYPVRYSEAEIAASLIQLAECQALLIDLRGCRGGEPETVALLCSYLFDETPVHLNDLYCRPSDSIEQFWTRKSITGPRFACQPVCLLASPETFSAGEEFLYNLQSLQRATVLGEPTRGGAHAGDIHQIDENFAVFIPDSRAVNPVTGTNWEGKGVTPDVPCLATNAFDLGYQMCLEKIAE